MTPSQTRSTVKAMKILSLAFLIISCTPQIQMVPTAPIVIFRTVEVPSPILDIPKLSWPIADHVITSGYGKRSDLKKTQTGGGDSLHDGVDIIPKDATKIHAMIHAAADGIVFAVFGPRHPHSVYGICVVIQSNTGLKWQDGTPVMIYTRYAHLSELWVSRGDVVKRGDPVGKMGKTGDAEGYHLHFEAGFDPMDFLEVEGK